MTLRKSELMDNALLAEWMQDAKVLESDERGVKVLRLSDGDILKIFRVRHTFSAAQFYSYARRFCRNAERLADKGIATVSIKQLLHLHGCKDTAVRYAPLAGDTLREIIARRPLSQDEASTLGCFIALLHRQGIHFRSLHPGNIVMTAHGEFGLIDIADMSVYAWSLWCNTRARSFSHFQRYPKQVEALGREAWQTMLAAYFQEANLNVACARRLHQHLESISVFR